MKKKIILSPLFIIILIIVFGAGIAGAAIYFGGEGKLGDVSLQKGLVGWWKFDGNAKDSTPYSNDGAVTGATLTTDRKGQLNKVYSFDGASNHISAGNPGAVKTVSFWMQANVTASKKIINIDGTKQIELNGSSNITATSFPDATIYVDGSSASANIPDTNWHFVTITDTTGVSASTFDMGAVSSSYFDGKLDEVRIYNRALSQAEVTASYQSYGSGGIVVSDLQKGLVGQWKMAGNAKDATPNANDGTNYGAILTTDRKGTANQAYVFDGNDYIDTANFADNLTNFTASTWFKIGTTPSGVTGEIVAKLSSGGIGSGVGWAIFVGGLSLSNRVVGIIQTDPSDYRIKYSAATYNDNNWHQAVMVVTNGDTVTFYVDGSVEGGAIQNGTISGLSNAGNVRIGGNDTNEYFNGSIDEVRIYNWALSATEVAALYREYDPGIVISALQKGLVGQWKMAGNAKDATPNANDGTILGAVLAPDRKGTANQAYSFNGSSDYVDVADAVSVRTNGDFSVSAWAKLNNYPPSSYQTIVSAESSDSDFYSWQLRISNSQKFQLAIGYNNGGWRAATDSDDVGYGQWYYLTATWDNAAGTAKLYKNGVQVDTFTDALGRDDHDEGVEIGWTTDPDNSGWASHWDGLIDDVKIYNRALTSTEITALYESY